MKGVGCDEAIKLISCLPLELRCSLRDLDNWQTTLFHFCSPMSSVGLAAWSSCLVKLAACDFALGFYNNIAQHCPP